MKINAISTGLIGSLSAANENVHIKLISNSLFLLLKSKMYDGNFNFIYTFFPRICSILGGDIVLVSIHTFGAIDQVRGVIGTVVLWD